MPSKPSRPRLQDYRDFRAFLKAEYEFEKAKDPAFSYGAFAKRAGITPRGHLKYVMDYGRRLSRRTLKQYVKGLRLSERDAEYFRLLVAQGQATRLQDREKSKADLDRWRAEHHYRDLPEEAFLECRDPFLLVVLYAMAALRDFRPDAGWIRRRLLSAPSSEAIREGLDYLFQKGHLEMTSRGVKKHGGLQTKSDQGLKADMDGIARWMQDEKISERPFPLFYTIVPLTRERIEELKRTQERWFKEQVLRRPAGEPGEEMHLVLWEVLPVTSSS